MSLISITQLDIELRGTQFISRCSSDKSVSRRQPTNICGLRGINKISTRCSWRRINIRGLDHCADSRGPRYHARISWWSKQHHARSFVERWRGRELPWSCHRKLRCGGRNRLRRTLQKVQDFIASRCSGDHDRVEGVEPKYKHPKGRPAHLPTH